MLNSISLYPYAGARLLHRRLRRIFYSLRGLNPYAAGIHEPTAGEEWKTVCDLLACQSNKPALAGELEAGNLWNTAQGQFMFPRGLDPLFVRLVAEEISLNIYDLTGREKVLVDCGANVGLFTAYALKAGATRVIAFEPSPANAACFRHNLAREIADGRVVLIEKGLLDRDGRVGFFTPARDPLAHAVVEGGETSIEVTTLDAALAGLGMKEIDFVKIDIEGSELRALEGAQNVLRNIRPRIAVATEHTDDYFDNASKVIDLIAACDYEYVCTQSLPFKSPTRGKTLITPFCTVFTPRTRR